MVSDIDALVAARGEGRLPRMLAMLERTRLLIIDDWGPTIDEGHLDIELAKTHADLQQLEKPAEATLHARFAHMP